MSTRQNRTITSHRTTAPPPSYVPQRAPRPPAIPCIALEIEFLQLIQARDVALGVFFRFIRGADLADIILVAGEAVEPETRRVR